MKITPLLDRVLVRLDSGETVTKGGIHIPDAAQGKDRTARTGVVEAVGRGTYRDGRFVEISEIKAGNQVVFGSYAGTDVDLGDRVERRMLREDDVLGVLVAE